MDGRTSELVAWRANCSADDEATTWGMWQHASLADADDVRQLNFVFTVTVSLVHIM